MNLHKALIQSFQKHLRDPPSQEKPCDGRANEVHPPLIIQADREIKEELFLGEGGRTETLMPARTQSGSAGRPPGDARLNDVPRMPSWNSPLPLLCPVAGDGQVYRHGGSIRETLLTRGTDCLTRLVIGAMPSLSERMKKRILFVEADPTLLRIYLRVLDDEPDRWETFAATNGWQALDLVERYEFDAVVSDVRLPGLSGLEVMEGVRKHSPHASRIMLSDISDQEEVARCLNSIHQFLAKPFEVNMLKSTLARVGSLDAYLQDSNLRTLVGQLGNLPSLPSLYLQIMNELSGPDPSVETVAKIIAEDPGMTARMLQIVNSAVLGLARRIGNPFEAVQYFGFMTVRSLVLSAHIFSCFDHAELEGFSLDGLWGHALGTGSFARMIMRLERAEAADAEDAYTAGMLHDLGKLMLADSLPLEFAQALHLAAERHVPLHMSERVIFGATHAGVAAYLLGLWGLPATIVEAVAFHHDPKLSGLHTLSPLTAVHTADVLEHQFSPNRKSDPLPQADDSYLASIGLLAHMPAWQEEAQRGRSG